MKKISIIILSVFFLGMVACQDQLNQISPTNLDAKSYYKTASDMTEAVNAVYRALNGWDSRFTDLSENRSDNIYVSAEGPREQVRVNNFTNDLSTSDMTSAPWNADYLGISRANVVLENLSSTNVPDSVLRNRLEGEAKFLRAFNYFDLIRTYGKVPIVTQTLSITESTDLVRASVSDVYSLVISDLQTAMVKLPGSYTAANRGRATSWAAKAVLALVYLTRSGSTYGIEGPGLASNEYSNALTLLNDIIANGKNYGSSAPFSLITSGSAPYASVFSYTNEYNAEIVWDLQAFDDGTTSLTNGLGTSLPTTWYDGNYGASLNLFAGGAETDAPKEVSKDLIASYSPNDKRDDFTILPTFTYKAVLYKQPQYVKFLDVTKKPAIRSNWPINFPVIRYADILLWKAEALIQSAGSSTVADQLINQVRRRAGLPVGEDVSNATIDVLLAESRREFAGEGRRWHDLVRSGKVLTVMNAWRASEDATRLKVINPITSDFIIYPIPFSEITINPNLGPNNPGYL